MSFTLNTLYNMNIIILKSGQNKNDLIGFNEKKRKMKKGFLNKNLTWTLNVCWVNVRTAHEIQTTPQSTQEAPSSEGGGG